MSNLIGVTGYKNSGKNAVCNILRDEFGYVITGFSDVLKSMALAIDPYIYNDTKGSCWRLSAVVADLGWDAAKEVHPEVRRLLQRIGTEGVRQHLGQAAWVEAWRRSALVLLDSGQRVCVSDIRFLNEANAVKDLGGQVWRVRRPGAVSSAHASETELDEIQAGVTIHNTKALSDLADSVMWSLT